MPKKTIKNQRAEAEIQLSTISSMASYMADLTRQTFAGVNQLQYSNTSCPQDQIYSMQRMGLVLQQYRLALHSMKLNHNNQLHPNIQKFVDHLIFKVLEGVGASIFKSLNHNAPIEGSQIQIQRHNSVAKTISVILLIMQEFLSSNIHSSIPSPFIAYPTLFNLIRILNENVIHPNYHIPPPYLPIIIWRNNCNMRFRSEFIFHCSNCSGNEEEISTRNLTKNEVFSVLRHGTTALNMLSILQPVLYPYSNNSSKKSKSQSSIFIRGNTNLPEQIVKDVCPQGLIYFDIDMSSLLVDNKIDNLHPYKNRYGACVLKIQNLTQNLTNDASSSPLNSNGWKYFKLGTKKYSKGFSQLLLATQKDLDEWWIMEESKAEVQKLSRIDNIDDFTWRLAYCKKSCRNDFWTHPEILVDGDLHLPLNQGISIRFESGHKCFNLLDGRRRNCIECDIMEGGGLCYANLGGVWNLVQLNCSNSEELSIEMFARSVPHSLRKNLKREVNRLPNLFDVKQFDKIMQYWKDTRYPCFVQVWKAIK